MRQLKDFQRATVDHAFDRLYVAPDSSSRFLVADEVGLGKTMIAKGIISKAIDLLWDDVGRIDVIYVCSNADIARQNVNRLNVMEQKGFTNATRLTMLPLELSGLRKNKVNFVSFTPGTSFEMKAGTGQARERALLYRMLQNAWEFGAKAAPLNLLSAYASRDTFDNAIRSIDDTKRYENGIDGDLLAQFAADLSSDEASSLAAGRPSLKQRFETLLSGFARDKKSVERELASERNALLGDLRHCLANTCIHALEPDLVVLDEFQRFKDILGGTDEAAELARELFEYANEDSFARVLLLSATPYKMYTTRDEIGDVDHYGDFVETLRFLQRDPAATAQTALQLAELRRAIYRGAEGRKAIPALRAHVEASLRKVMARTERLAITADRSGMLREIPATSMFLRVDDVQAYLATQAVSTELKQPDSVEYWKAAPYVLNFMEKYQLKKRLLDVIDGTDEEGSSASAIREALRSSSSLTLPLANVERQEEIDVPHPRMRWLLEDVLDKGAWRLLWIPPSLPYYRLGGVFADPLLGRFTKRLVFSAWKVAPKAIATLVSSEAERRMLAGARRRDETRTDQIGRTRPLLKFSRSGERLAGMPVLGLMYPSIALARVGDPLHRDISGERTGQASLEAVLKLVDSRLQELLPELLSHAERTPAVDESWYWAAPILLDVRSYPDATNTWLQRDDLATFWAGQEETEEAEDDEDGWNRHVDRAVTLLARGDKHGLGTPPLDLASVLAKIAVGGPAVCALRALSRSRHARECFEKHDIRDAAARVAHGMRSLFNLPEVSSLIRGMTPDEPYWLRTVEYSLSGCLQAVLDEYVHVAQGTEGLADQDPVKSALEVSTKIRQALGVRASRLGVDAITIAGNGRLCRESKGMRSRFAMRFGDESSDDEGEGNRKEQVRTAFNSPFWPFVLASTSVGQEGLDFHLYCHAVVHWNIPSNPVDMEQREGRVHRFKGHAVRRNVASVHGPELGSEAMEDPWAALFDLACQWRDEGLSDLNPYWVFPLPNGAVIERHVPNLPLSRDAARYAALGRSLAVYRMVFGQPRQEDLLSYLAHQGSALGLSADDLRIDLSPPGSGELPT